jgi:DNA-binding NarL/FixJ family response regulator
MGSCVPGADPRDVTRKGDFAWPAGPFGECGASPWVVACKTAMRLGSEGKLKRAVLAASDALTFGELVEGALEPLRIGAASSGALLYRFDERGILGVVGGSLMEAAPKYAAELFHIDPIQQSLIQHGVMKEAVIPRLLGEIDWSAYQRGSAYNEFYSRHGVEDLLGMTLTDQAYGSPLMSGVLLTRSRSEPAFDEEMRRRLSRIRPHLRAAVRRIERAERREHQRTALAMALECVARPVIIFDSAGRVVHASAAVRGTLQDAAIAAVSSQVLGLLAKGNLRMYASMSACDRKAEAVVAIDGKGTKFVVVSFDSAAGAEVETQRVRVRYGLTPSETSVLQHVADGLSNAQIATRLFISVETVRTHVQRILSKMGVRSRTHAAAMLRQL